jgi:HTH-type transcriptional regulator/antitoxin HigA
METKIIDLKEYNKIMSEIETYLQRGFSNLTETETAELKRLSLLAEAFEDKFYKFPYAPQTLTEMIEFKMFEKRLKKKELAQLLEVSSSRLSEIMHGKRKINLDFAKRLHQKLNIDANFILQNV